MREHAPARPTRRKYRSILITVLVALTTLITSAPAGAAEPSLSAWTSIAFNHAGPGYWTLVDGKGVFAAGGAPSYGGNPGVPGLIVANPAGDGYWLVLRNGAVQAFGRANSSFGSFPDKEVRVKKIYVSGGLTAVAARAEGDGLWATDTHGHVYTLGKAESVGDVTKNITPATYPVGIVPDLSERGYWIVDDGGHLWSRGTPGLGDATHHAPDGVVGLAGSAGGTGYVIADARGTLTAHGDVDVSTPSKIPGTGDVTGIALNPAGGYGLVTEDGTVTLVALTAPGGGGTKPPPHCRPCPRPCPR